MEVSAANAKMATMEMESCVKVAYTNFSYVHTV